MKTVFSKLIIVFKFADLPGLEDDEKENDNGSEINENEIELEREEAHNNIPKMKDCAFKMGKGIFQLILMPF